MYKKLKNALLGVAIVGAVAQSTDALAKKQVKSLGSKKFEVSVDKKISPNKIKKYFKSKYNQNVKVSLKNDGSFIISGASRKQVEEALTSGVIFK